MSKDDFFIGWAETPKVDRRFFLGAGLGLMAGTAATAAGIAAFQNPVGPGTWNMGEIREWRYRHSRTLWHAAHVGSRW